MSEAKGASDVALTEKNNVIALFQFIREMNKLKQKAVLDYGEYPWSLNISEVHEDPNNIRVYYRDRVAEETIPAEDYGGDVLLSVHKPEFQRCPEPDKIFRDWLDFDWIDYRNSGSVREYISSEDDLTAHPELEKILLSQTDNNLKTEPSVIYFNHSEERVAAYEGWVKLRDEWVEKQKIIKKTRDLFAELYSRYFELQRESETEELIVANGILCDRNNSFIKHPVLTHRVKLDYDAEKNTVSILDTETPSELYAVLFQAMEEVNLDNINDLRDELQKNDYHPLDRNDTPGFLRVLVHQLSSSSVFSESGGLDKYDNNSRLVLYLEPCYILRKRLDGTLKAIEQIIENVQETGAIPAPIRDIVGGGKKDLPEEVDEESVEEQLAAVGGESIEVFLSKEANREQLEIARRIEMHNAVIVQGPPGTGKTHTIANLLGHFLAQGKSVLVTSHTTKALGVLKEKIVSGLRDLCVSLLDDSNVDMEHSVDGITSYMSKTTAYKLKREIASIAEERLDIINKLADVRRKIFTIIKQECNCIVYNGEDISPSQAAKFVVDNEETLSYIPGSVKLHAPMPLSFEQLVELYKSNEILSVEDEVEMAHELPNPKQIMSPKEFSDILAERNSSISRIEAIARQNDWIINCNGKELLLGIKGKFGDILLQYPTIEAVQELKAYVSSFGKVEQWMKAAAVDGRKGGKYRQLWINLINQIKEVNIYAESIVEEQFGLDIQFKDSINACEYKTTYEKLRSVIAEKGKISWLDKLLHKEYSIALEVVTINGKKIQSERDCEIILHSIELDELRNKCAFYWDELLVPNAVPKFHDLDCDNQERVAEKWIACIEKYLDWYKDAYQLLIEKLNVVGISKDIVFEVSPLDSDVTATNKVLYAVENIIPKICDVLMSAIKSQKCDGSINKMKEGILAGKIKDSRICSAIFDAICQENVTEYTKAYADLECMYEKYAVQNSRMAMLRLLESVAPKWAEAISGRDGIHGQGTVPSDIEDAWKWKQLSGIVAEITEEPFVKFQVESLQLSKKYREITSRYAEKLSWYYLFTKIEADTDIMQALVGWKLTIKRIGKGTGKRVPALKAKARELMAKCQSAVPAWIMTINRALETLNPKKNHFDVVIIDEASQSDISSLAILYMGKKMIIVGDDNQVTPSAVGVNVDDIEALQQMYIVGKIPNAQLYDAKTSIYDIAKTTFRPLMLVEHFRCVPEIIGFSNWLSYDGKIKPLRDASSSVLLPAVVNYRVDGGKREGKTNIKEAKAIIALMKACIEQPEYAQKSFGVISLLGNEGDQVKVISKLIEEEIDPKEVKQRNILCGNSANFQGDERDVIFLSMVDSCNGNGPLRMMEFGSDDAYRKRYNVAASRARDQLWVVNSLDAANELKPGDIRKRLIDYVNNPHALENKLEYVEKQAESPFEAAVGKALVGRGYHLVQQWKVGAYRLDMVAVCGKKMVAIECDGERWHSGEAKIREDMERQTILERIGWRFIRIRGSEYYSCPERTLDCVIEKLNEYGILPEEAGVINSENRDTELLRRVKHRAAIIMQDEDTSMEQNSEIIEAALNPKCIVSETSAFNVNFDVDGSERKFIAKPIKKKDNLETECITSNKVSNTDKTRGKRDDSAHNQKQKSNNKARGVSGKNKLGTVQLGLPGFDDIKASGMDIISLLEKYNVPYHDKRSSNGALWIIGGDELLPVVSEARKIGYSFTFRKGGGKVTKGKDAWWVK